MHVKLIVGKKCAITKREFKCTAETLSANRNVQDLNFKCHLSSLTRNPSLPLATNRMRIR